MIGWRAWYAIDGEIRRFKGSTLAEFKALPDDGAQGFVEYYAEQAPDGSPWRGIIAASDWYWWVDGENGWLCGPLRGFC